MPPGRRPNATPFAWNYARDGGATHALPLSIETTSASRRESGRTLGPRVRHQADMITGQSDSGQTRVRQTSCRPDLKKSSSPRRNFGEMGRSVDDTDRHFANG